jgi:hypothetical protein
MKKNIIILGLEPLPSRYSEQWHEAIPKALKDIVNQQGLDIHVMQIDGIQRTTVTTQGAFLNFSDTNYWKSSQLLKFIEFHDKGLITPNDVFLFTDGWNPVILQIKYMNDLLGYNWKIHSLWHSGAYDPTDILGYKMEKPWPWMAETAMFHASSTNWYATDFHKHMFLNNLNIPQEYHSKASTSGQPHGAIVQHMKTIQQQYKGSQQGVIWPHRYNDDKQPMIAEDLSESMKQPWCITQKLNLSKHDYYAEIAQHQVVFSCSLHENLGISIMEAVLADVIPVLPDRCSYSEMYVSDFLYPSEWTVSYESYVEHKQKLMDFIQYRLDHPKKFSRQLAKQKKVLLQKYLSADVMFDGIVADIAKNTSLI